MIKYDYQNSIGFIINRIGKSLIYVIDQELRKKFGITFGQWKVLIILANSDSGLTQKEIADKLVLEGPTLIPIIDKLEKDELVIRKNDPKDRRINRVYLTDKTNDLLNDTIQCVTQIKQICVADITEGDVLITKNTLEKMWRNLQSAFNLNCYEENKSRKTSLDDPGPSILVGKN
ncbi:MAG: MarR family winged helix-turn-helix transcriptional regulator [Candidatus Nitrosocosmicus sp.]|jgi:MarR family transcriptional regulator for hemolysin|uniref:MarR family winged helix-turn-helix transcriptional regulator n=1 Tax=Candidatus Nitrosocosmicus agrestis TaxID=2563600 RepID=UPI00122DDE7B|nr:MarR family transcriptional regulator [Candidatus Nitrosocosmicus sp. SS]KAA2281096.1 MarR family transcriptional regulator [Candidatus Nitrosocosmicus sp. SS]KAF0869395.1 MarR family transcriptional regulator [Candidatus Nitrosocosmicus sp. SS]MDR4491737.1 MarR family transcriptional regulator [Candidatus Nitrosocosmicus sp.]